MAKAEHGSGAADLIGDVRAFHEWSGQAYAGPPRDTLDGGDDEEESRIEAIQECLDAFDGAWRLGGHGAVGEELAKANAKQIDALANIVFIALGMAYRHGWNFGEAWDRVVSRISEPTADATAAKYR